MLVHGALRLAVDVPTKTVPRDLPQLARFLQRTLFARNASNTPATRALSRAYRSALTEYRRSYATTTQATKPTATVKKAVKAQAAKKTTTKTATKTPASKRTTTKASGKKTGAKKAAPKKKPAKKAASKRAKKTRTPEEKEKAAISALRKLTLKEPVTPRRISAFNMYVAENATGKIEGGDSPVSKLVSLTTQWKDITPAERERYNHLASEKTAENRAKYQAWVLQHTPSQIQEANNARTRLRRKLGTKSSNSASSRLSKIQDDRSPKRPSTPFAFFFGERRLSGDFKGVKVADSAKLIGEEWKALSDSEKKRFNDQYEEDKARYKREMAALT